MKTIWARHSLTVDGVVTFFLLCRSPHQIQRRRPWKMSRLRILIPRKKPNAWPRRHLVSESKLIYSTVMFSFRLPCISHSVIFEIIQCKRNSKRNMSPIFKIDVCCIIFIVNDIQEKTMFAIRYYGRHVIAIGK